jgi:transposase-like protein
MTESYTKLIDGNIVVIDAQTGESLAESGPWVPKVIHPTYTPELGDAICHLVREGMTYKQVVGKIGIKHVQTIYSWRTRYPDFARNLKEARRDRADIYYDRVMEIAEQDNIDKEEVAGLKLRSELYKWGAERSNPEYGTKVTSSGPSGPMQIIIDTGIRRGDELEHVEVEVKEEENVPHGTQLELPLDE